MTNFSQIPGVKFVCGRPFDTEFGHHETGDVVEQALGFNMLESIVRSGLLYPYAPKEGYDYLPPHLFNDVQNRQEVLDRIEGDKTVTVRDPFRDDKGSKPEPMLQAEREVSHKETGNNVLTHRMNEEAMQKNADEHNKARQKEEKVAQDAEKARLKDLADGKDPAPSVVADSSATGNKVSTSGSSSAK